LPESSVSSSSTTSRRGGLLALAVAASASLFALFAAAGGARAVDMPARAAAAPGVLAGLAGATGWVNSPALAADDLRGKVVLVDFWTYSCINCLRTLPYVKAWAAKYRDAGLVVVGVHSPEFEFEHDPANVRRAAGKHGIDFPVALDNDYAIWRAFRNQAWPAFYFVDAQGQVRGRSLGEGNYAESEQTIRQLLAEAGHKNLSPGFVAPQGAAEEAPAGPAPAASDESYLGYDKASGFAAPATLVPDRPHAYPAAGKLRPDQWALSGAWTVERERAVLQQADGRVTMRFRARDLHMVLGPSADGHPVRFRVRLDGQPPQGDHGADIDAQGNGTVTAQRLYQLVRQSGGSRERLFEIEFLDPGAQAYTFTFG
jgi:thiol-disulfide isomerase/thioredoxin